MSSSVVRRPSLDRLNSVEKPHAAKANLSLNDVESAARVIRRAIARTGMTHDEVMDALGGTLTLEELLKAKPEAICAIGEFLQEQFGEAVKTRKQIAREKIPALIAAILDAVSE